MRRAEAEPGRPPPFYARNRPKQPAPKEQKAEEVFSSRSSLWILDCFDRNLSLTEHGLQQSVARWDREIFSAGYLSDPATRRQCREDPLRTRHARICLIDQAFSAGPPTLRNVSSGSWRRTSPRRRSAESHRAMSHLRDKRRHPCSSIRAARISASEMARRNIAPAASRSLQRLSSF